MAQYKDLQESVIAGDEDKVKELVSSLLKAGKKPIDIIAEGLTKGMSVVGERMKAGDMFIPEVLASAESMKAGMEVLKPHITGELVFSTKAVMGQVSGDVHNIGRKFVNMMLESSGFAVVDLGEDVPPEKFVEAVKKERPNILGLSALLTTTMPNMKVVIEALRSSSLRNKVKIIVGGAPVTQAFADSIGADGYAPNAISAVDKAKQLLGQK